MAIEHIYLMQTKTRGVRMHVRLFQQNAIDLAIEYSRGNSTKYEVIELEVDDKAGLLYIACDVLQHGRQELPMRYVGEAWHGTWTPAPKEAVI